MDFTLIKRFILFYLFLVKVCAVEIAEGCHIPRSLLPVNGLVGGVYYFPWQGKAYDRSNY